MSVRRCRLRPVIFFQRRYAAPPLRHCPSTAPVLRHPDRLAVQNGGTRVRTAALLLAHARAKRLLHGVERAVVPPASVLLPDRRPGQKIVREGSPGVAVLGLVDRVPDLPAGVASRRARAAALRPGHGRASQFPLRVRLFGQVRLPSHAPELPDHTHFVCNSSVGCTSDRPARARIRRVSACIRLTMSAT